MRVHAAAILLVCLCLAGCAVLPTASPLPEAGPALQGLVHGGQQPIVGAHIYLLAANITGYGQPSVSLLSSSTGYSDSIGNYVLTDAAGNFTISSDYTCTANQQLYLYALGGNPGAGLNSAAAGLAAYGTCPTATAAAATYISINEVSTIAAAYALAGFATDATHVSSSGTPLAQQGVANAFTAAANLVNLSTASALTTTPAGNGMVPQATINALANIIASCVNSTGLASYNCSTLFSNSRSAGTTSTQPTDTATAAINIAHNPAANVANLFNLQPAAAVFAPSLSKQPPDWTMPIIYLASSFKQPGGVAVDGLGNIWIGNQGGGSLATELSSSGSVLSGTGYPGLPQVHTVAIDTLNNVWLGEDNGPILRMSNSGVFLGYLSPSPGTSQPNPDWTGIAFDPNGNAWISNSTVYSDAGAVYEVTDGGTIVPGSPTVTGGGINSPQMLAVDGTGNIWIANPSDITKVSPAGVQLSGTAGFSSNGYLLNSIAIDASGSVWSTAYNPSNAAFKFSSTGTLLSPANGFPIPAGEATGVSIDGDGNAWICTSSGIQKLSQDGTVLSGASGYFGSVYNNPNQPYAIEDAQALSLDGSGNVWITSGAPYSALLNYYVVELVGASAPVVTPLALGTKNNTLGTRP